MDFDRTGHFGAAIVRPGVPNLVVGQFRGWTNNIPVTIIKNDDICGHHTDITNTRREHETGLAETFHQDGPSRQ